MYIRILIIMLFANFLHAQTNLVPNFSFEEEDGCPEGISLEGGLGDQVGEYCVSWDNANSGSSDYFNACYSGDPEKGVGVANFLNSGENFAGKQIPYNGSTTRKAYCGLYGQSVSPFGFEYLQVQLTEPLMPNLKYHAKMRVSLAEESQYASTGLGMLFTTVPPPVTTINAISGDPQVIDNGYIEQKKKWVMVEGVFTASGGEEWLTIGTFSPSATAISNSKIINENAKLTGSYYYIDEVEVYIEPDPCQCPNILIENRLYTSLDNPKVVHGNSYVIAGYDVGSPETNGDVVVTNGADVTYKARDFIFLDDGFKVEPGGNFKAILEPCTPKSGEVKIDFVPNAFSPNGDDYQENIPVTVTNANFVSMDVYRRNGELIYKNNFIPVYDNRAFGWDGRVGSVVEPPGVYVVYVQAFNCSEETSRVRVDVTLAQKTNQENISEQLKDNIDYRKINIFPNPTLDIINITMYSETKPKIIVKNVLGEIILEKEVNETDGINYEIDFSSYQRGIYLIHIFIDEEWISRKIILR